MKNNAPVFVRINDYREVLDVVNVINDKISEAKSLLGKINQVKERENKEIEQWKLSIAAIEDKLRQIDQNLSEVNSL